MDKRDQALQLLKQNLFNQNLIKHSLAVEAVMATLARYFSGDEQEWAISGLLHDIDYEKTKDNPSTHSQIGAEMLKGLGYGSEICDAILAHNDMHKIEPRTLMAKSLYCVDPATGLIIAATLVLPSKKLADLSTESVLNRFKEKGFAKGANRTIIGRCEDLLNLSLEKFIEISLAAMKTIAGDLGL